MSEIKTQIHRREMEISSQNKVVRTYSEQLKSSVISNERRREILKNMRSEMIAEQFRRPEIRSAEIVPARANSYGVIQTGTATNGDFSGVQTAVRITEGNYEMASVPLTAPISGGIQTGGQAVEKINSLVDNSFIHTKRNTDYIKKANVTYSEEVKSVIAASENIEEKIQSADKFFHRRAIMRNMRIKQMRLKNKKYTIAKGDTENSPVAESAEIIRSTADSVIQSGGMLRTAVKTAESGASVIRSMVRNGVKIGSIRDVGIVATAVSGGVRNIASDMGNQLLKTQIDKSKITDTGTETIKQGMTEIRHIDNARKAVLNTARTAVKAGITVRNMPRDTRAQVRRIRNNAQKVKSAAKKTVSVLKKIVTSKAGIIILLAIFFILLIVVLLNSMVTIVSTAITSLFSWLMSEDKDKSSDDVLNDYTSSMVEYIDEKQSEIDEIVEGFVCDRKSYPPYDEITELNQYGNKDIADIDENAAIAILAVLRYRELQEEGEEKEMKFEFTDEEIQEVLEKFYDFEYRYEYGHCSAADCQCRIVVTIYNEGTPNEYTVETTEYYCDVDHQWLYGEVTNHSLDEVLAGYEFTDEEKDLYTMYLAQIEAMNGDGGNA